MVLLCISQLFIEGLIEASDYVTGVGGGGVIVVVVVVYLSCSLKV